MFKIILFVFLMTIFDLVVSQAPDCTSLPDSTMQQDPSNCLAFYVCIDGEAHHSNCPDGMFFDLTINNCNIGQCPIVTTSAPPLTTRDPTIEDGIECPAPNVAPIVSYVPSNERCDRYFICVNGSPIRAYCREGLYFNPLLDKCDFRENVECEFSTSDNGSDETTTDFPVDENGFPICPQAGTFFYPHPSNCNLYFSCFMGFRSLVQCPFQNFWDINESRCMARHLAVCVLDRV